MAVEGRLYRPVIDHETCGRCAVCRGACPAALLPEQRRETDSLRGRVFPVEGQASVAGWPPASTAPNCREGCPLHQEIDQIMHLTAAGKVREAAVLLRSRNPLPGVCGRVCPHPCAAACTRGRVDEPLAIHLVESFLAAASAADAAMAAELRGRAGAGRREKVAVIGGGPAGLAAAHYLLLHGCRVEVFEADHQPGGLPAQVIPAFRLPAATIAEDLDFLRQLGLQIHTGIRFGRELTWEQLQQHGFAALLLAVGTQRPRPLAMPTAVGEENGRLDCREFLQRCKNREELPPGRHILVIGGGNAALDAARAAVRLPERRVAIVYRRRRQEMPAAGEEIEQALREGVELITEAMPVQPVVKDGRLAGLVCCRTTAGTGSETPPALLPDSEFTLAADLLVTAVGLQFDPTALGLPLQLDQEGRAAVDPVTRETSLAGVYAAGDMVSGPSTIVEAMADGRRAAAALLGRLRTAGESV
ncbi:MAG: FAD-dependent oxidoreductase [Deltaproteobacteria bacterium]|nr:FAD-dependent oxidoreductase [Deltaproteobacteria bacterium]